MGSNRVLWVVEMRMEHGEWEPTVGVGLERAHGWVQLREWKSNNPDDKFRLRRYLPAPPTPEGGKP